MTLSYYNTIMVFIGGLSIYDPVVLQYYMVVIGSLLIYYHVVLQYYMLVIGAL